MALAGPASQNGFGVTPSGASFAPSVIGGLDQTVSGPFQPDIPRL